MKYETIPLYIPRAYEAGSLFIAAASAGLVIKPISIRVAGIAVLRRT